MRRRALGIPTIGYVNSWDNLTSKGTVHVLPDVYIVWNEPIAQEAVEIHDIPASTVRITGAPHLDMFFSMRPRMTRSQLCAEMGCPDAPYMVFLCSSRTIWENESSMVMAMADALAREFGTAAPTLVVRPHPTNPAPVQGLFAPRGRHLSERGRPGRLTRVLAGLLQPTRHASCVFGLNTTAFLEAVGGQSPVPDDRER